MTVPLMDSSRFASFAIAVKAMLNPTWAGGHNMIGPMRNPCPTLVTICKMTSLTLSAYMTNVAKKQQATIL